MVVFSSRFLLVKISRGKDPVSCSVQIIEGRGTAKIRHTEDNVRHICQDPDDMTIARRHDSPRVPATAELTDQHDSEWVYTTALTRSLRLSAVNAYVHSIPSIPRILELPIFACGYAFNPPVIPLWIGLVHRSAPAAATSLSSSTAARGGDSTETTMLMCRPIACAVFYVCTILVTLAFTEIAKASFATTRPEGLAAQACSEGIRRRYGSLVSSLKSRHSFPSGDCAQAANVCLFLWLYLPMGAVAVATEVGGFGISRLRDVALFGLFLPGVCFARVFYRCHWVEDCIGGVIVSLCLHWLLIPNIREAVIAMDDKFLKVLI